MDNFKETLLDFRDDTLDFIDDHRKSLIIISIVAIVVLIGLIIFFILFQPVKITIANVDQELGNIIGTKTRTLELRAIAQKNNEVIQSNFEWEVSAGSLDYNEDGTVKWELPTDEGTYSITAKNSEATGTKYVTVLGNELSNLYKSSDYQILVQDTDGDGLTDLYEGSNSRTSQTSVDTDNDGLFDGDEIILDLDPLKEDSKGDGVKDGERRLEYVFKSDNVTMNMTGKGNFTQTSVDKYSTETLDNVTSVIDGVYSFYTEVALESAQITITYDKEVVTSKGITPNNLAVYELNEDENTFEKIRTTVNESEGTVTFGVDTLGKYFIADSSKLTSNLATELVFLIDNSGSMYPATEVANSEENDVDFKRVDAVNDLIDKLQGNYRFGAGKFTFEYDELMKLSSDKVAVKNRVNSIKTESESFTGTYIGAALEGGLTQFSENAQMNRRYIILLSDGSDTSNVEGYNDKLLEEQIQVAKTKGVKVYTVGLGSVIDEENLQTIAKETSGKYYFAATADDLDVIFDEIAVDLNYNLYDSNNDGADDSVVLADSGFLVGRDGFSFSNFSNTQVDYGYGYGMVLYAKMFFEDDLPDTLDAKSVTTTDGTVIQAPAAEPTNISKEENITLRTYTPESLTILANLPADFWSSSVSRGLLAINATQKQTLQSLGFTTYQVPYEGDNAGFSSYESIRFDMTNYLLPEDEQQESPLEDTDIQLLSTLARLDITKYRDEKFYFYDNNDTAFSQLKDNLEAGTPVMIRINDDYTVLAVKLLADSKNMNKYKIEVYDPNYAGIPKYIDVERFKFSDIAEISNVITDEYEYKFSYQGNSVGICLSIPNVIENV